MFAILTHHRNILPIVGGTVYEKCLPDNELPFLSPNIFGTLLRRVPDGIKKNIESYLFEHDRISRLWENFY